MIATVLKASWLNLRRDYPALALTFVLPIIFFSIFAVIFGGMGERVGGSGASATKVIVVDRDHTEVSQRFLQALGNQPALHVLISPAATQERPKPKPYTRDQALDRVRRGRVPVAVVIPRGFAATFGSFSAAGDPVEIIHDPANPLVLPMLAGLLQATAMSAAPDVLMERGLKQLEAAGGALTPMQKRLVTAFKPILARRAAVGAQTQAQHDPAVGAKSGDAATGLALSGLVRVKATDAGEAGDENRFAPRSIVAYYAAGIGVMFLLFSMANGAGGALLEEEERGTLERLLVTDLRMGTLIVGHWCFFTLMGAVQVTLMFVWAALVFGLDLWSPNHLAGFLLMTSVTAAAAAAFGIAMGTLCKSRAQLGSASTILILIMSALGGSMIPRFVMPAFMETTALFTFNGWALDGYLKVFWYEGAKAKLAESLTNLLPQVAVLGVMAVVFLGAAKWFARRWETA